MIMDSLNELAYPAEVAGLNYSVFASHMGISVHVHGYSHKLIDLMNTLIRAIVQFSMDEERFSVIHEQVESASKCTSFSFCW